MEKETEKEKSDPESRNLSGGKWRPKATGPSHELEA
jgi:hypothetical protein